VGYLIIIVLLFALIWLLLIRPQRRRQSEQAQMQDTLKPGDEILSAGGIHGTVKSIEDEVVHLEIAPGTTVRLDRRAVAVIETPPEPEPDQPAQEESEPEPKEAPQPERSSPVSSDGS
jgi:preprotein translocase subunit YajC